MPDQTPEFQAQIWNKPSVGHQPQPAPFPAKPPVAMEPLRGTDTILVTRAGQAPVAVPLSAIAAYVVSVAAAIKQGSRA